MFILKNLNYNKYFLLIRSLILLIIISLIPWIEFINSNLEELEFIFNDNFYVLIVLYFVLVTLLFFLIKFFHKKKDISLVCLIGGSVWILFQHNLLRNNIYNLFKNSFFGKYHVYFSEIALIIILLIIALLIVLNQKKIFSLFVLFFLVFNVIYSSVILFSNLEIYNHKNNQSAIEQIKIEEYSSNKKVMPNIYFFLIDAMMPLNEFEKFYKKDLKLFKKHYLINNFTYYENTKNSYKVTVNILTSFFSLEEKIHYISADNTKKLKKNIAKRFPGLLKSEYSPKLLTEFGKLGYEFKWIGNKFADCSRYNYEYCLYNKKENYIDLYLLKSFLDKSPIIKIFDKLTEIKFIRNLLKLNYNQDAISKFNNFLNANEDYIKKNKPTFFFIHDLEPHWPYKSDANCNYKNFPGNVNFEGYKESYLCAINKIKKISNTLNKIDPDSLIVFQSDHSWEMSLNSDKNLGNRLNIFNLIKNNVNCSSQLPKNPNNVRITNYILNCLKK